MNQNIPRHVAIVMDGNGRWAESRGLPRAEGHRAGMEAVKATIRACLEFQIPVLSLFAFSMENWSRPEREVSFLMQLFAESLVSQLQELHEHGIRLRFTGDKNLLPEILRERMQEAEAYTGDNTRLLVNVVVSYGGKWDIVQAARALASRVACGELTPDAIDETTFAAALATGDLPEPDLFIRTSGEQRLSNFYLWQFAYTELYFTALHWPDFNREAMAEALAGFARRERRFGALAQPCKEVSHV